MVLIFLFFLFLTNNSHTTSKIIGLIPVHNEQAIIAQCLRGLAEYTDAIIVLDDASEDNTLNIVKSLAQECNIEKIIEKKIWYRDESHDRNLLLYHGRARGGTHFIVIDADELFTAQCKKDTFLRKKILKLQPGDELALHWIELWGSLNYFKATATVKPFIFCDDEVCSYDYSFIHAPRVPQNLTGSLHSITSYTTHGLLHFRSVNTNNLLIKKVWYQCLERIHNPTKPSANINAFYQKYVDTPQKLGHSDLEWFDYSFLNKEIFTISDHWRIKQIQQWITEYGTTYFADLDIWNINFVQQAPDS